MATLQRAIAITAEMHEAMEAELAQSREHPVAIRTLDSDKLLARGHARAAFTARLEQLQSALAEALAATAKSLGLDEVTVDGLRRFAPAETDRLAAGFARLRAQATSLKQLDALNQLLASRGLACVRGYVRALIGPPAAYDRRGLTTTRSTLSTSSKKV
jgi:hypothetical protein